MMEDYEFFITFICFYLTIVGCYFWCKFCRKSHQVTPFTNTSNVNVSINNFVTPHTNEITQYTTTSQSLQSIHADPSISVNDVRIDLVSPYIRKPSKIYQVNV